MTDPTPDPAAVTVPVTLNGGVQHLPPASTVADAVLLATAATTGIAVAVNGEVVPRSAWSERVLTASDSVEVLVASQGG